MLSTGRCQRFVCFCFSLPLCVMPALYKSFAICFALFSARAVSAGRSPFRACRMADFVSRAGLSVLFSLFFSLVPRLASFKSSAARCSTLVVRTVSGRLRSGFRIRRHTVADRKTRSCPVSKRSASACRGRHRVRPYGHVGSAAFFGEISSGYASDRLFPVRWRTASNSMTAAAADTFNDSTLPRIGMASRISHNLSTSFDIPVSSLPITIAVGPLRSASNSSLSLFSVAATIREPLALQYFQRASYAACATYGDQAQRPGRTFHRLGVHRGRALERRDESVGSCALGAAGDRAEVAHVGHAVQHDEQGRFVLGNRFEQLVQADVLDGRRQRYGALMVALREPVQLFDRDPRTRIRLLPAQFGQLAEQYAVGPFLQIDFLDLPSRPRSPR